MMTTGTIQVGKGCTHYPKVPHMLLVIIQRLGFLNIGWDNNFNGNLETSEILETIIYCSGTALADSVTSVDVTVAGTGYSSD